MKKVNTILTFLLIILMYHLTKNNNMLLLTISFSILLIYKSLFSSININSIIKKYQDKEYYYTRDKIFKNTILLIIGISILLTIVSYLIGILLNIKYLSIVNIAMTLFVMTDTLILVYSNYLNIIGYKKIINIYNFINIILEYMGIILLYKVFNFNNFINITILYLIPVFTSIIILLITYFIIIKKIPKYPCKREETKINIIKNSENILFNNKIIIIKNIFKSAYLYFSIIILYYILLNKYNYNNISTYITNTYLYGIIIIYFIYLILRKKHFKDIQNLKNIIERKEIAIEKLFNTTTNKIIKITLSLSILLMIISKPLTTLLFNYEYNFLFNLIPLLFFYTLYDYILDICSVCIKRKKYTLILLFGLLIKLIFEIPLINSAYRMGYELSLGSILSNILGFIISIIIGIILLKNRLKLNLLNNFNNILNIIYDNIILCLILVLFTLIINIGTKTFISSLLVIIFYVFIAIIYYKIKLKISVKNK